MRIRFPIITLMKGQRLNHSFLTLPKLYYRNHQFSSHTKTRNGLTLDQGGALVPNSAITGCLSRPAICWRLVYFTYHFYPFLYIIYFISFYFYLQMAAVTSWASAAVSGRGHSSHKAPLSPSWAPPFSGCSPLPPNRCCYQTQHCRREKDPKS